MLRVLVLAMLGAASSEASAFDVYGGFSIHSESLDAPEFEGNTGLGIFGFKQEIFEKEGFFKSHVFCEHISYLDYREEGYGLNHCGIKGEINIF